MAITFLELAKELQGFANDMAGEERGNIMVKLASDAIALNRQRVQEEGKNAQGENFKPYSTKDTLIGRKSFVQQAAANSLLGSKEKRKQLEWVTIGGHKLAVLPGGYKKIREVQGRQTGFVDFTLTGRMWGNIKLVSDRSELNNGVAVIKATEDIQKKKLAGNTERRGEILGLSKKEESRLAELYEVWLSNLLRRRGLIV